MKKNKMKCRVISALLAVLLCFSCMGSPAVFAAGSVPEDADKAPMGGILAEESVREWPEKAVKSEPKLTFPASAQAAPDAAGEQPDGEGAPEDTDAAGQSEKSVPTQPEKAVKSEPKLTFSAPAQADMDAAGERPDGEGVPEDAETPPTDGILPEESVPEQPGKAVKSEPELTFSDAVQAFMDAVDALDREQILSTANTWGLAHKAWLADPENADLKAALDEAVTASDEAAASLYAAEDLYYEIPEDERESEAVQAAYLSLMSLVVAMQQTMDNPTEPSDPGTEGGKEPPSRDEIAAILYGDLPDAPSDYYMGSYGLPVAVGETKISIGEWAGEMLAGNAGRMNANALNMDGAEITVPLQAGEDYAIVPIMVQVEYPANNSTSRIILPESVTLLSQDGSGNPASSDEAASILNCAYTESSAAASGILVRASDDFAARFVYEAPDGTTQEKALTVHVDKGAATTDPVLYNLPRKSAVYAERPTPSTTSGRITQVQQVNGTWLIWFNGQEAYCCDHGLTGKADGCPTYSYSHTSIVEGSQYTPGDHYRNRATCSATSLKR